MNTWRLIAHHENADRSIREFKSRGKIAIGWDRIGDLRTLAPRSPAEIASAIRRSYPELNNAHLGGPSLWRLYKEMSGGDLVIVGDGKRRRVVMRVEGPYEFGREPIGGYRNFRPASPTDLDPEEIWHACGRQFAKGESVRWTLARCQPARGRVPDIS